jgi:lysozyme
MANPIVIDISHWQPDPINWDALKANGTMGVIHKATEGTSYVDPELRSRMAAARNAGLLTSTYHFLKKGSIDAQMDHYLKTVDPLQGERLCIDHEEKASLAELKQAVARLWTRRPDLQLTIYSGHLIKDQLGSKYDELLAQTSLWIAHYTSGSPTWPKGTWPNWSLHQYTDKGSATGIKGPIDANKWNGSEEALVSWMTPGGAPVPAPEPEPDAETKKVTINITAPEGVEVTVNLNGKPA